MFCRTRSEQTTGQDNEKDPIYVCEDCYRESYYGQDSYVKVYKHCILAKVIHPAASRNICRCDSVPHSDTTGRSRTLFPVNQGDKHRDICGQGGLQCGLLKLGELVAQAKYDGMQQILTRKKRPSKPLTMNQPTKIQDKEDKAKTARRELRTVTETTLHDASNRTPTSSSAAVVEEKEADEDIPFFFRKYTEKYPFGNVHMALRIGPLVIENGVAQ
jgi:hypothetical protein